MHCKYTQASDQGERRGIQICWDISLVLVTAGDEPEKLVFASSLASSVLSKRKRLADLCHIFNECTVSEN